MTARRETVEASLRAAFCLFAVAVPFAFASVAPWARSVIVAGVFGLALAWLLKEIWLVAPGEERKIRSEAEAARALGAWTRFWARRPRLFRACAALTGGQLPGMKGIPEDPLLLYRLRNFIYLGGRRFMRSGVETPMALFLALLVFQILPLPPSVMRIVSPGTHALYTDVLPGYGTGRVEWTLVSPERAGASETPPVTTDDLWAQLERSGGEETAPAAPETLSFGDWFPVSVYPAATYRHGLLAAALAVAFFLAVQLFRERRHLRWLLTSVAASGFLMAMMHMLRQVGVLNHVGGEWKFIAERAGVFVNPNHFCAMMELAFPVALGLAFASFFDYQEKTLSLSGGHVVLRSKRRKGATLNDTARAASFLFLAALMLAAVTTTRSRGGVVASAWAIMIFGALILYMRRKAAPSLASVAAFLLVSVGAALYVQQGDTVAAGFMRLDAAKIGADVRVDVWKDVARGMRDFPLWGAGWGTFEQAFPMRRTIPDERIIVSHAESDFWEIGLEGGLAAFFLFGWALAAVFARGSFRLSPLHAGAGAGLLGVMLHGLFDFPLHMPAICFVFVLCLAAFANLGRVRCDEA